MSDIRDMLLAIGWPVTQAVKRAEARLVMVYPDMLTAVLEWAGNLRITRGLSANTVAHYVDAMSLAGEWLAQRGIKLEDMTPQVADDWQRDLFVQLRQSAQTRSLKLTALKQFYAWREERSGILNPVRAVRGPKKPKRMPQKFMHRELQAMFKKCDRGTLQGKRDYALLLFLLCTGARLSETVGMELEQLELRQQVGRAKFFGKGARERAVSFEGPLIPALIDWLEGREKLPLQDRNKLFAGMEHSSMGTPLTRGGIRHILQRIGKAAEIKTRVHPHKFRSTFATELYDQGFDLAEISYLLGHASVKTTMQYIAIAERIRSTRLSSRNVRILTGEQRAVPLWVKNKRKLKNHEQFPEG